MKRWMIVTWVAILGFAIAIAIIYGGRNCQVPKSGLFHWLSQGHQYVPLHRGRTACRQVK